LQGLKILAIDDSSDTRELLSILLEGCGATVSTASSVREALDVFNGWKPDLVVCDIGMPELDGYEFIKTIRLLPREKGGETPAIALTGYVRVEDRSRALQAGYQMFVPKPIEAAELCSIIGDLVNGNAKSRTD
jgi:CheY-like chemotaxis protein